MFNFATPPPFPPPYQGLGPSICANFQYCHLFLGRLVLLRPPKENYAFGIIKFGASKNVQYFPYNNFAKSAQSREHFHCAIVVL